MIIAGFGDLIADRVRTEHRLLAARWFERLLDLIPVDAREVFPTDTLLDHVPELILEISEYLRHPEESIVANSLILDKARELGNLRHEQQASLHQVVREYQLLRGVLGTFVMTEMERLGPNVSAAEGVAVAARMHRAIDVLSQATVESFVTIYTQRIGEQNDRLEQFTRIAAHEWRQPLGALQFAIALLRQQPGPEQQEKALTTADRNVRHLVDLTHKLETVARLHTGGDDILIQEVSVATVAQEAARQLREMSEAQGVTVRIDEDSLPTLVINVGRLELVFVNLLSNAIKYSDPAKSDRFVAISGQPCEDGWHRIDVEDNGVGIPQRALATIFQRFTRAHNNRPAFEHVTGVGLGLSIVEDSVRSMGARIAVVSEEGVGTRFELHVPPSPQREIAEAVPAGQASEGTLGA